MTHKNSTAVHKKHSLTLALIRPNIGRKGMSMFEDGARMEPLALAVLAAATPEEVAIRCYDDRLEPIPFDEPVDLVAISVEIYTARRAYEIADAFLAKGVTVILGGIHTSLVPEEAAEHATCVITGDAEHIWPQVLTDFSAGRLLARYDAGLSKCPQSGLLPRREIFKDKKYLPLTLLQFSRGCTNSCRFCASSAYFKQQQLIRRVDEVVAEIKAQQRKLLFFVDDNIVADPAAAKELFAALIPLKIKWVGQASMDMLADDELMRLMVASGCMGNVIGFESLNESSIAAMQKTTNSAFIKGGYDQAIDALRSYGLQTWAAFTTGHDSDTLEGIRATCDFALRHKFCFAAFNILQPYPATPLYEQLKNDGRLLYGGKWWLHPEYRFNHASFMPANMSPEELTQVSFECRRRWSAPSSIVKRAFEPHTNMRNPLKFFTYLAYNPLFRREVYKKQDMTLGYEQRA